MASPKKVHRFRVRSRKHKRPKLKNFLAQSTALFAALIIALPFLITLLTSLMQLSEAFRYPPQVFPQTPQWRNYVYAWQGAPFGRYFLNSLLVSGLITLAQSFTSILAAYAFARLEFPGRKLFFGLFLATLMIPSYVVLIPNYLTLSRLNMINTYWALILPFVASGFSVFLIRQHFKSLPGDLEDAAMIDGANRWTILWRIFVPLAKASIAAAALFTFLGEWNAYLWPLIVTDTDSMRTVQIGLASFQALSEEEGLTNWPVLLAASVIVLIPTLVAFIFTEKQLVRGVTLSGLKG